MQCESERQRTVKRPSSSLLHLMSNHDSIHGLTCLQWELTRAGRIICRKRQHKIGSTRIRPDAEALASQSLVRAEK